MQEKVWLRRKRDGLLRHVDAKLADDIQEEKPGQYDRVVSREDQTVVDDKPAKPRKKRAAKKVAPKVTAPKTEEPESADVDLDDLLAGLESGENDK